MTPKTNTTPIWNFRDKIINARIEEVYVARKADLKEQIDLLAELAEAIECGADVAYFDPRTVVEMEADEQDAQHYADMLTASNP
jgi:hypothetical protein